MRKTYLFMVVLLLSSHVWSQTMTINQASGWLESAYVEWQPVSNADSYNVYYSSPTISNQKIDNQLIRSYGSYFRADIPGLSPGNYTLTVKAVVSNTEFAEITTNTLTVLPQDRTGFSFANGRLPGAYKADGTPKDGAVILYLTENTKNTVSLDVTGATANPCVGIQTILDGFKKGKDTRPLIIRLIGQVTDMDYMLNGDLVIENSNNASSTITFEGIGEDAVADGWGIRIKNASNIEVRNLGTMNCDSGEGDNIGLQQNNDYIWVHHCDFFYGNAGSDSDQAKGDGALDCKKSTYVTFSYNHFWDSGKSNLLGLSESTTDGLYITYHHNWYDHSDSRHPRVRFYSAHIYNNYYDGNAKYGVGATEGSSLLVEGNYFRNCKYPMLISMQGSDVYNESTATNDYTNMATFSKEDGGSIKAFNNYMTGQKRFVAYGDANFPNSTVDFDAVVVSSKSQTMSSSIVSAYGGNTHNNFDTNSGIMYSYTVDTPEQAKANVLTYAGRINGGDFNWTFNNAVDDTSYAVNTALKNALVNYQTSLVYIQGENDGAIITPPATSYTLTTATTGLGTVTGAGSYNVNTTATLTATAETGYTFSGWSGSASGNTNPLEILMDADKTVTAIFTENESNNTSTEAGDYIHNFTTSGTTSDFYSITGNLSTTKGTVTYNGLTLTQCLKIESSTTVNFTTTGAATLTLVFNDDFNGNFKIDGNNTAVTSGILIINLESGTHTLSKADTTNLYYISLTVEETLPVQYSVSTSTTGNGTVTGSGTFDEGNTITISAVADSGWEFSGWSGDASGTNNPLDIYLDSDKVITANFTEIIEETPDPDTSGNLNHNFTESGKSSNFYAITGNLSDTKGTVYYSGLTLTECLKIESSTTINFTAASAGTLTLVFNETYTGDIKIDGTNYQAVSGIVTVSLNEGAHSITKVDPANLYYMSLSYSSTARSLTIQEEQKNEKLVLYPNPVSDQLNVASPTPIQRIDIYNMLGVLVKSVNQDIKTIDLSHLNQGQYLIRIQSAQGINNRIIIKK